MSKQLKKHHNNPHHSSSTTNVTNVLWNESIIEMFLTLNCHFQLKHEYIIQSNASSREKVHLLSTYLIRTVFFACKGCLIGVYFSPESYKTTFSLENAIWIEDSCLIMDLFLTNTQIFTFHAGLLMFLSAVWTLILTAPIHCRASIAEKVM